MIGKSMVKKVIQTKCFPTVEINSSKSLDPLPDTFTLSNSLLSETTYHRETFDRLGLLKPRSLYNDTDYHSKDSLKLLGIEFFSLLRSGMDVRTEFSNSEELRRFRDSYILHVLDYVIQDRERVYFNDQKIFAETFKDRVTLDNVFELA
jgi:hypothetical protein